MGRKVHRWGERRLDGSPQLELFVHDEHSQHA